MVLGPSLNEGESLVHSELRYCKRKNMDGLVLGAETREVGRGLPTGWKPTLFRAYHTENSFFKLRSPKHTSVPLGGVSETELFIEEGGRSILH